MHYWHMAADFTLDYSWASFFLFILHLLLLLNCLLLWIIILLTRIIGLRTNKPQPSLSPPFLPQSSSCCYCSFSHVFPLLLLPDGGETDLSCPSMHINVNYSTLFNAPFLLLLLFFRLDWASCFHSLIIRNIIIIIIIISIITPDYCTWGTNMTEHSSGWKN